jgi:hypothetical protein
MVAQIWTKPLACTARFFFMACVALHAQSQATGSLNGRLTDLHSHPIDSAIVTLQNNLTGAEVRATTTRAGAYRFERLAPGEYTIIAESSALGRGQMGGIVISAAHEARIQTAIRFVPLVQGPEAAENASATPNPLAAPIPDRFQNQVARLRQPGVEVPESEPEVTPEVFAIAPGAGLGNLVLPTSSVHIHASHAGSALVVVGIASFRVGMPMSSPGAKPAVQIAVAGNRPSATWNSAELESLPLSGRDWESFLSDASAIASQSSPGQDQRPVNESTQAAELMVDGASTQLAFGGTGNSQLRENGGSLIGPGASEGVVRTISSRDQISFQRTAQSALAIETRSGANGLHGRASLFDRQDLWGAQNPFTQWVRETAPANSLTVPTFTPVPYSPSDRARTWGIGLGGMIRRSQLFWFGSLDGFRRNDPGVASVKHPENFFAQPSNDQMQVLSARLGLNSANPVAAGVSAYSTMLETLDGLLGPAARSTSRWNGFGRLDWKIGERHSFSLEGTGAHFDAPGAGLTRASETYGTHSFGSSRASETWMLGRWEAFVTPNLLAVTQTSYGRQIQNAPAKTPSAYEQTLNINAWGQLPQIVVDSRYGFTIGNPARFGKGSYPDEHLYQASEQVDWVHGSVMIKAGFELSHNTDATSRLRNQTGTYHYSSVENFVSDALSFAAFGINGQLDPMDQHNCDQIGRVWRDSTGTLHGLGYLPCYSYYSQMMGPAKWWLGTNDWGGYITSQWQPNKQLVFALALRWDREQLPPPLEMLANPDLPLTKKPPDLGNGWGPRASLAWGSGESHWPVLRTGYGVYFGRTHNAVIETALTQTGSLKGDLNFFMRPTDNLNAGGAPPFPYVLSGEPATIVKPGAVEFAQGFRNAEVQQGEIAIEENLPGHVHVETAAIVSLGRRLPITIDANIDPHTNPKTITYEVVDGNHSGPIKSPRITVPFYASWPSAVSTTGFAGRLNPSYQQISELESRANSTYEAAVLRLTRSGRNLTVFARYTYAHAMDWNPNETAQAGGPSVLDPNDFRQEYGTSNLDVRHSASAALTWKPSWKISDPMSHLANGWMLSGIGQFHSGLPYTMRTSGSLAKEFDATGAAIVALASGMSGYGGDNRVYGVGRNTYRYPSTWKADLRLAKRFDIGRMRQLELLAESFNLFNHQNVTELETTGYSISSGNINGGLPTLNFLTGLKAGQTQFGQPININATDYYHPRQFQFGARLRF